MKEFGMLNSHKEIRMTHRIIELQKLWDQLDAHDWMYVYADDGNSYRKGEASERKVIQASNDLGVDGREMMEAFKAHHFSGPIYGTAVKEKPARPGGPKPVEPNHLWF